MQYLKSNITNVTNYILVSIKQINWVYCIFNNRYKRARIYRGCGWRGLGSSFVTKNNVYGVSYTCVYNITYNELIDDQEAILFGKKISDFMCKEDK